MEHVGEIEKRLWSVADHLRANSNFASNEYFLPVMGLIFLRHAYSRFLRVKDEIVATLPSRGGKTRDLTKEDFSQRGSIFLKPEAQFDHLVSIPDGGDRAGAIIAAMESIEADYQSLDGALPKSEYQELGDDDLGQLLRTFNDPALQKADGDVFGKIYEYFLTQFADQKAHDGGEFFTPTSIVQTIVNVIEPDHGKIIDPACGSGGMFVQSAHFIEYMKANPSDRVTFYGMEKNPTTIRLAKMNLAVHGLEGKIGKAISYYEDPHEKHGPFDFVMANPPFNVDEIDAEKIKNDPRLTFGLPGVNKAGKVSNGNYVWMSFFHSYLSDTGRAGIVMSSQASSSGGGEAKVREAMIKTGDVDVMVAIRGNFFYTRTVPCELWFFDKGKSDHLKDKVLMIDARNIFRKVTRKIYDFTPEQQQNITAIVWLYRGQTDRYLELVESYFDTAFSDMQACDFSELNDALKAVVDAHKDDELTKLAATVSGDIDALQSAAKSAFEHGWNAAARDNDGLKASADALAPIANQAKSLIKELDHLYKLATRVHEADVTNGTKPAEGKKRLIELDEARKAVTEHLKEARYFHTQAEWLQIRFPNAELCDVEGLVKLVGRGELEANDWSLTPGRYVGVAPEEEDEDFDFEEALRDIHIEIEGLNDEARELALRIKSGFEGLIA
ncbi:N-6 DNA methylase [Ponticaulis sp.]|uniref:class I SAM-dependent DNA methyltransferase n=1 Tax=Ponticaulis sp. TaxID=2020902 RepID=UPI000B6ACD5E|nr:N-6 DNA methylase [Ponticaulis sp.]MAI91315.1 DNA methyltransferase [Ponticaulis sp.]OUX97916.1 MAG: DNA methyltransferase [Hyphomonadaceae bacterium TMED5]|tara:strand:+ start:61952 stop:63958 length:2007 start_codon:yes stop_codon:yes gene_type:complete